MRKKFLTLAFLPLFISNINKSSGVVENYVKSEATSESAKVETNISTKINEKETTIKVNQPGEVEVKVKDENVEVKTSKGITPTIIIKGSKITPTIGEVNHKEDTKKIEINIYYFLRGLFRNLFNFFHR